MDPESFPECSTSERSLSSSASWRKTPFEYIKILSVTQGCRFESRNGARFSGKT
jgi:hypothetical protein